MLTVSDVSCVRQERVLFSHVAFQLRASEILHVTGVNGAGKSSLLQILVGLLLPHQGEIQWNGISIQDMVSDYKSQVVYIGHKTGIKSALTVLENMQMAAELSCNADQMMDWTAILKILNFEEIRDVLCHKLSAGQRQRVALARLWMSRAPLWVLDEPFTALDQSSVRILQSALLQHSKEGGMVVLTSHAPVYLEGVSIQTCMVEHV